MLRSWIWQLFQGNVNENTLKSACDLALKGQPLVSDLWDFLQTLAASLTVTPTYLIVDGLDECTDSTSGLVKYLVELLTTQVHFRAIIFGRPHAVQPIIDTSNLRIEIEPDTIKSDINLYIQNEIGSTGVLNSSAELRDSVCLTLQAKSDGMFLWVKLMIDDLQKSDTQSQVSERLRDLPHDLEKAYRLLLSRLVQQLDHHQLKLTRSILMLAVTSMRPLELEELPCAYALILEDSPSSFKDRLLLNPAKSIMDVCQGLIKISNGVIQIIHLSLKEFLLRPEEEWLRCDSQRFLGFRAEPEASVSPDLSSTF